MAFAKLHRNESGVTLLELIVGLLLASIVVSAVAQFCVSQHYHVNQQREVSDVQQNLRSSMQEMTEQIRMAGYGLPSDMDPIVASNTNPDTVLFFYRKSPTSRAELTANMADALDDLHCDGFDISEFKDHTWAYIFDAAAKSGEFFYMSDLDNSTKEISHPIMPLSKAYPSGSEVIAVEILKYYVDRSDAAHPTLMRSRQGEGAVVFSEGIDSLQLSYQLTSGTWSDAPAAGRLIRSVQISMSATGKGDADGVLHAARDQVTGTEQAVRMTNGATLPAAMTLASPNPVYTKGDFNTVSKKPSAVLADAYTILSNSWDDSKSNQSLSNRDATDTKVNLAFLTGNTVTGEGGARYNGGLENLPRLLEKWSGDKLTLRGSFVDLWQSRQATGAWSYGSYYEAPTRDWGFDTDFLDPNKLPPGTPQVNVAQKTSWRQNLADLGS